MKESGRFPAFEGWQDGYGAITYSVREKDMILNYIKNQKEHHKKEAVSKAIKTKHKVHKIKKAKHYY